MIEFTAGIVVGAVFAPFWMALWNKAKPKVIEFFNKK